MWRRGGGGGGACRQGSLVGRVLLIRIIPTNKTYCFVMVWRMRLIHHPQSTLMNYWLVVSDVEPRGSSFQCAGLETLRNKEIFTFLIFEMGYKGLFRSAHFHLNG